jgi:two-component system, NtrC family, response regulator AtoC
LLQPTAKPTVLVVARETSSVRSLLTTAEAKGWHLETALSGSQALEYVRSGARPGLVILYLTPGDLDGLHTMCWLRRIRPELPVVMFSSYPDLEQQHEALRLGAQEYLVWPLTQEELEKVLCRYVPSISEKSKHEATVEEIERIGADIFFVAAGANMRKLRAHVESLAKVNSPVLIVGESGSGRELVARMIHQLSVRSAFPFVKVSCGALPGDMLERELLGNGHTNGDSGRATPCKLESCQQGTLFLDEITEMPMELQAKIFHVLENRSVTLALDYRVQINCRVLASTRVYAEEVEAGKRLGENLYYAPSAFTVHVPPLRERSDDIPLLVGYFMNQLAKTYGLPARMISPAILEACRCYSWPGNLHELENFVKCYLLTGDEELAIRTLDRSSTPGFLLPVSPACTEATASESDGSRDSFSGLKALVQNAKSVAERNAIAAALRKTQWNRKAAARLLQVSYRTLLYRIQQYHMSPPTNLWSRHSSANLEGNIPELIAYSEMADQFIFNKPR